MTRFLWHPELRPPTCAFAWMVGMLAACGPAPEHPKVAAKILAAADEDGDGSVSPEEFAELSLPRQGFAPLDTNQDRRLDAAELERAFLTVSPTDFQDEGRRAVHRKYGHPFGGPVDGEGGRGKGKGKGHHRGKGPPPGAPR